MINQHFEYDNNHFRKQLLTLYQKISDENIGCFPNISPPRVTKDKLASAGAISFENLYDVFPRTTHQNYYSIIVRNRNKF